MSVWFYGPHALLALGSSDLGPSVVAQRAWNIDWQSCYTLLQSGAVYCCQDLLVVTMQFDFCVFIICCTSSLPIGTNHCIFQLLLLLVESSVNFLSELGWNFLAVVTECSVPHDLIGWYYQEREYYHYCPVRILSGTCLLPSYNEEKRNEDPEAL